MSGDTGESVAAYVQPGGDYEFECSAGHRSSTREPYYSVCDAVVWNDGSACLTPGAGRPCGAFIESRVIPYAPYYADDGDIDGPVS